MLLDTTASPHRLLVSPRISVQQSPDYYPNISLITIFGPVLMRLQFLSSIWPLFRFSSSSSLILIPLISGA